MFTPSVQVNDCNTETQSTGNKCRITSFNESSEESSGKVFEDSSNLLELPYGTSSCIQKYISIHISEEEFGKKHCQSTRCFRTLESFKK